MWRVRLVLSAFNTIRASRDRVKHVNGWSGYGQSAKFYDLFDRKENVSFFLRYGLECGEILDVGAGTGRIAIPLAREGVEICAVEPSPQMRGEFERKLEIEPESVRRRVRMIPQDAASFDSGDSHQACMLSGTFDHLLDREEREAALRNIARQLTYGAVLVFDVFLGLMTDTPLTPAGTAELGELEVRRFVGGTVLRDRRRRTLLAFEVRSGGRTVERIEETSFVGIVDRDDVHSLLSETGFRVEHECGGYDCSPYREGDPLLVVESRRVLG
jgi:SAM-dependent methyltransferase